MSDFEDELAEAADRMVEGGKGARGAGKKGGAPAGGRNREVLISKALSTLLRHRALIAGIRLDTEGYAPLDRVMLWPRLRSLNPTLDDIRQVVADDAKQRFSMKPNPAASANHPSGWLIRANQGHTIAVAAEGMHTRLTLEAGNVPDVVVHGTYFAFWPAIEASGGLKRMGRQHVHFATGLPSSRPSAEGGQDEDGGEGGREREQAKVVSGMRGDAELLVFVDVKRCLREEPRIRWWLSANGVVLADRDGSNVGDGDGDGDGGEEEDASPALVVPLRYVTEARGRVQGVGVLWRDGEKVADLPPDVVARVPFGKGGGTGGEGGEKKGAERGSGEGSRRGKRGGGSGRGRGSGKGGGRGR
ncbi:KptA family-domain-containing protein [Durotheca rogersii]|uniref:KptA family-domain-containing protein n=1 Tax=Durotheca rogersii TaxID=419775 RepID=UPI00222129A4|nr:KptA family-domain-containing protein [Durotheca rogersii]KAI5859331.1 KptA family-domain-containing protein [Durotheca rogersii]